MIARQSPSVIAIVLMVLCATFCRGFSRRPLPNRRRMGRPLRMVLSSDVVSTSASFPIEKEEKEEEEDPPRRPLLDPLIVCGPSGAGKGTIIARFMDEMGGSDRFGFTVSHTTRRPREGEVDGVHYHFVDAGTMRRRIREGAFLESAEVHGNLYGTSLRSLRDVRDRGKRCLLDVDVEGVRSIKEVAATDPSLEPRYVFIAPPSLDALKDRLERRGTETPESLARRTANAMAEVEYGTDPDNFDAVVVNDDLDAACEAFSETVRKMYDLRR